MLENLPFGILVAPAPGSSETPRDAGGTIMECLPVALTVFRGFVLNCMFAHLGKGDLDAGVDHYDV
jgi:hypothetical protein